MTSILEANTLQHAATRCNTLQHTTANFNELHHTATYCNTLQVNFVVQMGQNVAQSIIWGSFD